MRSASLGASFSGGHGVGQQAEDQGECHKPDGHPLCPAGQLSVPALGLVLGQEGVRTAGDGARQAGALARLGQHDKGQKEGGQHLDHREDQLDSIHESIVPFKAPGGVVSVKWAQCARTGTRYLTTPFPKKQVPVSNPLDSWNKLRGSDRMFPRK